MEKPVPTLDEYKVTLINHIYKQFDELNRSKGTLKEYTAKIPMISDIEMQIWMFIHCLRTLNLNGLVFMHLYYSPQYILTELFTLDGIVYQMHVLMTWLSVFITRADIKKYEFQELGEYFDTLEYINANIIDKAKALPDKKLNVFTNSYLPKEYGPYLARYASVCYYLYHLYGHYYGMHGFKLGHLLRLSEIALDAHNIRFPNNKRTTAMIETSFSLDVQIMQMRRLISGSRSATGHAVRLMVEARFTGPMVPRWGPIPQVGYSEVKPLHWNAERRELL